MDPVYVIDNTPDPLIAVNSTGGITLSNKATREELATWIVVHQREHKTDYWPIYFVGITGILAGLVLLVKVFRRKKYVGEGHQAVKMKYDSAYKDLG